MARSSKPRVDALLPRSASEQSDATELLLRSREREAHAEDSHAVAAAWVDEIERRIDENEPGVLAETVFSRARARLR